MNIQSVFNGLKNTGIGVCAIAILAGCTDQNPVANSTLAVDSERPFRLVAHRGESVYAPENTVPAYELAWKNGAAWAAETDVYLTKDNVLVCNHDSTTDRTAKVPGTIRNMTFAELQKLDVGKWKDPQWAGTTIPALREVFAVLPENKHMFLEIKSAGDGFAEAYENARKASGISDEQITIISFSQDELRRVRESMPHMRTLWLCGIKKDENGKLNYSAEELIEVLKKLDVTGVDAYPNDNCIDAEYIRKVKDAGFEFHVWTINRFNTAKELYDMGVDSITTDCPSDLMKEFNKQSK